MTGHEQNGQDRDALHSTLVAHLPFGKGVVGQECANDTAEQQEAFGRGLLPYARHLTILNTADCVEDRSVIQVGNVVDPVLIEARIVGRLPGGLMFSVAKAATAANLAFLRDTKTYKKGYAKTDSLLKQFGYRDAGHTNCGASFLLEPSVSDEIPEDEIMPAMPLLTGHSEQTLYYLRRNRESKRQRLLNGYYSDWNNTWHEDKLASRDAENFSVLAKGHDNKPVAHEAKGLVVISNPNYGFATTEYNRKTGNMAFVLTSKAPLIFDIAKKICGSQEEENRFLLEIFGVDPTQVLNGLAARGLPIYDVAS